jgi:hypothetical protein
MAAAMKLARAESQADEFVQQQRQQPGAQPQEQQQEQERREASSSQDLPQQQQQQQQDSSAAGTALAGVHSTAQDDGNTAPPSSSASAAPSAGSSTTVHRVNTAHALLWAAEYSLEQAAEIIALGSARQAREQGVSVPEGTKEPAVEEFLDEADQALRVAEQTLASIGRLQSGLGSDQVDKLREELATLRKRIG